jgi:hypothetical protein
MVDSPQQAKCIHLAPPIGESPGFELKANNAVAQEVPFDSLPVHLPQHRGVPLGESPMTKERLVCPDSKRNDRSRFPEVVLYPLANAGPHLVEAIVQDNHSTVGQGAFSGAQIVRGILGSVSSVDADEAKRAAAKRKQMTGGKLLGIAFVNYQAAGVRVPAEISLEPLQIPKPGVIYVHLLMREKIDGDSPLILQTKKIQQDEKPSVMHANLGHRPKYLCVSLFLGEKDDALSSAGSQPALY